jgi:hypothetical protein
MPDTNTNGAAETRSSLREVAEAAWEDVVENAPDEEGDLPEPGQGDYHRDNLGRFASKETEPGEAEPSEAPSPEDQDLAPQQPEQPTQPPPGVSSEAPQNWSAQDRQLFGQLPEPAREFLLRRHSDMEGEFQRRVQANAQAAQFTQAVLPVFEDPVIAGSLQQAGVLPHQAIEQWGAFHKRAMSPDPNVRMALWQELGSRMGLNPAAAGQMSQPGVTPQLSEKDMADPAIRHFADHIGRTATEVQALRDTVQRMVAQHQDETLSRTRMTIDSFADETDQAGNRLRPDFDEALPALMEMARVNPGLPLTQATYEEAGWRTPSIRQKWLSAQQNAVQHTAQQRQAAERAKAAVRGNVRGMTSPVAKPPPQEGAKSLRATLEASADEIGL